MRTAIAVAALTGVGFAIRLAVAHQSVFADELSTYWIVSANGLAGVVSTVHTNAEITPPLYFVLSWLTTRIDLTPELLRAPSLVAGVASIPLVYLLGRRTVGRTAGLIGAALVALSPFMIFYSAEARGYAVAIVLVLLSTLSLLAAVDTRRARWWVAYALCSVAAVYTHYTAGFALLAQLIWLLWAHPEARPRAFLANAGAAIAFMPWLTGLINDFNSPTTKILSKLEPFDLHTVRISLEHWSVGYPYLFPTTTLRALPGVPALVLMTVGAVAALAALALRLRALPGPRRAHLDRGPVLVVALAVATAAGEALASAVGSYSLFGTRNLAVSWPGFALALGALVASAGPRLRYVAMALLVVAFAIGAAKMLDSRLQRPDYRSAAGFIDRHASAGDVVIDAAALTPGPLSGLDVALQRPHRVIRVGRPQERDHPFSLFDPIAPVAVDTRRAVAGVAGGRLFVVAQSLPGPIPGFPTLTPVARALPARLRPVQSRTYPGIFRLIVVVYTGRAAGAR